MELRRDYELQSSSNENNPTMEAMNEFLSALGSFAKQVTCQLESPRGQFSSSKANDRLQECIESLQSANAGSPVMKSTIERSAKA